MSGSTSTRFNTFEVDIPGRQEVKIVAPWVLKAWRQTPESVMVNSVAMRGFRDESTSWHIARHDVYDTKFWMAWELQDHPATDCDEVLSDVMETLDDIILRVDLL